MELPTLEGRGGGKVPQPFAPLSKVELFSSVDPIGAVIAAFMGHFGKVELLGSVDPIGDVIAAFMGHFGKVEMFSSVDPLPPSGYSP